MVFKHSGHFQNWVFLIWLKFEWPSTSLLQHGLLCDSSNWVTNLRDQSLAFLLADRGCDVWLGNSRLFSWNFTIKVFIIRGNKYSNSHEKWTPKDSEFWNWTFDNMASADIPATLRYIYEKTGQKINYVGHRKGSNKIF